MLRYCTYIVLLLALAACGGTADSPPPPTPTAPPVPTATAAPAPSATTQPAPTGESAPASGLADVTEVQVSGEPGSYQFAVTIASPDTGCEQYADWWEVVREDGTLVYRRVLLHSHVDEQPFTRSGGPVEIAPDEVVLVRAHMYPGGYGGALLRGTVADGFESVAGDPAAPFAPALAEEPPLPDGCAF